MKLTISPTLLAECLVEVAYEHQILTKQWHQLDEEEQSAFIAVAKLSLAKVIKMQSFDQKEVN